MNKHTPQKKWTTEELNRLESLVRAGKNNWELAEALGVGYRQITEKAARLRERIYSATLATGAPANPQPVEAAIGLKVGDPGREVVTPPEQLPAYEEDAERAASDIWRKKFKALEGKYEKILHERSEVDLLVADIKSLAPLSYSPAPAVSNTRAKSGAAQSALLMLSDTHVGQTIFPDQTLGFGEYNFEVFLSRLKYLEESTISILENHTTTDISELVVTMLGDMLHGALNHGSEADQLVTIFQQYYGAGHAIAQFLRNLARHVPLIRIYATVGNHPRFSNQHKMPTGQRFSNFDMFLYALIESLTCDIPNVKWFLDKQPFAVFEVQGHVFRASHGDHLKGGDKALGIPNHAIGREVSVTTQLFNKMGRRAPNYYLCGHLHRGIQLPHATGEIIINGGFPGLDNYALAANFNPVDPMQRLMFIHPKFGRTAEYPLSLKFAEAHDVPPYAIPAVFRPE